jgi:hypothetical protein
MSEAARGPRTRRRRRVLLALGIALVVVAILLAVLLRATAVTYPGPFRDTTVDATGTATLLADPVTLAPLAQPTPLPLHLQRRVHTLDTLGGTVVVERDDAQSIAGLPPVRFVQRYTVDDTTLRNVPGPTAFAYTPADAVDRASAYSVAFPFGAGAGPYAVWNDEVGQAVTFNRAGTAGVDGRTLVRYRGVVDAADLQPALTAQLVAAGLPSTTTYKDLAPRLAAAGVDVNFLNTVTNELGAADKAAVTGLESSIPLTYQLRSDVSLLVEPRTGTIVSLDHVDETVSARPDIPGIGRLYAILVKPGDPNTQADRTTAAAVLAKLLNAPPVLPVLATSYTQAPASVGALAAQAGRWADEILVLTIVVPIVIGVLGLVLCLVARLSARRGRRVSSEE